MTTPYKTGYGQLLTQPVGWASTYSANLPPLERIAVREYPSSFEDGCWNDDVQTLSSDIIKDVGKFFRALEQLSSKESKFNFAVKRFNLAHLRESDEDTTIDAAIGMEALLSDSNEEMTHKLAMRIAALSTLDSVKSDPTQVMKEVKDVYKFRSAVVHGDLRTLKNAEKSWSMEETCQQRCSPSIYWPCF